MFYQSGNIPSVAVVAVQTNRLTAVASKIWTVVEVVVVYLNMLGGAVNVYVSTFGHSRAKVTMIYAAKRGVAKVDPVNCVLCVVKCALGDAHMICVGDLNVDLVKMETREGYVGCIANVERIVL